jgi:1-acyl-sn-glycerol-3-phosphate acyltransferase
VIAQRIFYRFVRAVLAGFCRVYWRFNVSGREHIPTDEPFVLAPVHRSNVDFAIAAALTKRRMRFMGKDSLWKIKPLAFVWNALGAFPVHRGSADREALRRCIEVVEAGEPLVIFPEGTRQEGPVVQPLFEGAAYIATRTRAPIVPVGIGGSQRAMPRGAKFLRPVKIHVVIGPVLRPKPVEEGRRASRGSIHELTQQLHTELQALFDKAQVQAGS